MPGDPAVTMGDALNLGDPALTLADLLNMVAIKLPQFLHNCLQRTFIAVCPSGVGKDSQLEGRDDIARILAATS